MKKIISGKRKDDFQAEGAAISATHADALNSLALPKGKSINIHMVHLNHIDLMWYWQLDDTIQMILDTIRWTVDLIKKHPDARYSHTQVFALALIEKIDPPLFKEFKKLVKSGKIAVDSGQVVEPDHNLPSGESIARQFLYGQKYLQKAFNARARVLINSDSFGHCRNLPQIMQQAGITGFIFKRPRQKFVDLPETPFYWQGLDGTKILSLRFINKGNGLPRLSQYYKLRKGESELQKKVDYNLKINNTELFGSHVSSDAGGVSPYVQPAAGGQWNLRYNLPAAYFDDLRRAKTRLPTLSAHLNFVYQGCYTTSVRQKEYLRKAERELKECEALYSLLTMAGGGYPQEELTALWWKFCLLQFHDIVTGTGSPETFVQSESLYNELFLQLEVLRRKAQLELEKKLAPADASQKTKVIKNYHLISLKSGPSRAIVEIDAELPIMPEDYAFEDLNLIKTIPDKGCLADAKGELYPYQIVAKRNRQRFKRGALILQADLPGGLAHAAFSLTDKNDAISRTDLKIYDNIIENDFFKIEVGGRGIIKSIYHKKEKREILENTDAPICYEFWPETEYIGDYGTPMKAWFLGVTHKKEIARTKNKVKIIEDGPVRATLRTWHSWHNTKIVTDISLYAQNDFVEIRPCFNWNEKEVLARLCIKPDLKKPREYFYGVPFGSDQASGNETEIPAQSWICAKDNQKGIALMSKDRSGAAFNDGYLRSSIVRCATGDFHPRSDQGKIETVFRIYPFRGDIKKANVAEKALDLSSPPLAWQVESCGNDKMIRDASPITIDGQGVMISALKLAEDIPFYVMRLYEAYGRKSKVSIGFNGVLKNCRCYASNLIEDKGKALAVATL